ncbi:hypothetical protein ABW20_dc0103406 [Dactylellina cionopaga]|nr:hypothetical protein ABW20_dc0103406 [Dactylellina cionopaga]
MAARFTFSKQLRELRFQLCQSNTTSSPLRSFITKSYPLMKKNNPDIPILIREAQGVPPRVFARYGQYSHILLLLLSEQLIMAKL